jgi:large subunit ribosomal protein L7/L12
MRFKRFASGFCTGLGILLLLTAVYSHHDRTLSKAERQSESSACLLLGLPLTLWGAWSAWAIRQQQQQQEQERLRSVFFGLIQHSPAITPLQFAIAANVDGKAAKQFLEEQVREFAADFNIDDRGNISYQFHGVPLQDTFQSAAVPTNLRYELPATLNSLAAIDTFDVILESVPVRQRIAVIKSIRQLTGLGLRQTKKLIETTPQSVKQNISLAEAEACQRRLQQAGATAKIVARSRN